MTQHAQNEVVAHFPTRTTDRKADVYFDVSQVAGDSFAKRDNTSCYDIQENMLVVAGITIRDVNERRMRKCRRAKW
jgi:hypothetical protein